MKGYSEADNPSNGWVSPETTEEPVNIEYVHRALMQIVLHRDQKAVNWAVNYARHGLTISDPSELKTQCLYVLNNIQHWRGQAASDVRTVLKQFCGIKK